MEKDSWIALVIYPLASSIASVILRPLPRLAAIADDKVQPVPWVFIVFILGEL
jgi:hypothetical protein